MKAIAVTPGKPNSIHLEDVPKPSLDDAPEGRGVLVRALRAGVDGTDKEINAAEYGNAPPGHDYLIIGHAFEIQRRLKVWEPRRALILGSGTIGLLMALAARLRGLELTVASLPQPPYRNSELVEQLGGVYVSTQDADLAGISKQRGPF